MMFPHNRPFALLAEVARQLLKGDTWDSPEEAFTAFRLSSAEADAVCDLGNNPHRIPRPGDGSDQPAIPVDDEGWGFPIPKGTDQPTLW
jgi:hypothetical protein